MLGLLGEQARRPVWLAQIQQQGEGQHIHLENQQGVGRGSIDEIRTYKIFLSLGQTFIKMLF